MGIMISRNFIVKITEICPECNAKDFSWKFFTVT